MVSTAISKPIANGMVQTLARAKLKQEQLLEVYAKAIALVVERQQWANGYIETLYEGTLRGNKARIFIRNDGGRLNLYLYSEHSSGRLDRRFYSKPFLVGLFKPDKGWCVVHQDSQAYLDWNRAVNMVCKREVGDKENF